MMSKLCRLSEAVDFLIHLAAAVVTLATACSGAEPLDLSILDRLDTPAAVTAAAEPDALDLSILDALTPAVAAPPGLDASILEMLTPPAETMSRKPRRLIVPAEILNGARRQIELGTEPGTACVPMATIPEYPRRGALWSHPGVGNRSELLAHLQSGVHAGKFSPAFLRQQSDAELEALHSDDHEGRAAMVLSTMIADASKPRVKPSPAVPDAKAAEPKPSDWGGRTFRWNSDGQWRTEPEPGTSYYGAMSGVLVPVGVTTSPPPQTAEPRYEYRTVCVNGVCKVQRVRVN